MPQTNIEKRKEYNRKYYETNKLINKCEHDRKKSKCKQCGGSNICKHGRQKAQCKDCGGSSICEHDRRKKSCKECNFILCLVNLQRVNLRRCLNNSNLEKTKPSIEYLDCDIICFKNYIKSKMVNGMTWDNFI